MKLFPNRQLFRLAFICFASYWLSACSEPQLQPNRSESSGEPIIPAAVEWQYERDRVEAVGTSRAWRSVMLYPDDSGEVTSVNFTAGEFVEKGALLLELEADDEKLAVDLAEVQLADAQRLLDRYRRTEGSGAVTPSDLDAAKSAVERAELELQRARVALEDRKLTAPFAGHMGLTTIDPGARINPETPVASLDNRSMLLVNFELPEILLGQLHSGDEIGLTTWTGNREAIMGRVVDVDSRIDPQTRTFAVRAHVANPQDQLRPGMSFRVQLDLAGRQYPAVPEVALQWGGDGAYVWAIRDGKAQRVPATIVQRRDGNILIDADLSQGALVVAEGVQRMREGETVRDVSRTASREEGEPPA